MKSAFQWGDSQDASEREVMESPGFAGKTDVSAARICKAVKVLLPVRNGYAKDVASPMVKLYAAAGGSPGGLSVVAVLRQWQRGDSWVNF
jgi:hypothetical protein